MRFRLEFFLVAALFIVTAVCARASGIEVPLTVQETAGIDRQQVLVTTGIPLPGGALKSAEKLQIIDAQGRFIPAQFWAANRWWEDGSIKWVQVDFAVNVAAHGKANYFLREVGEIPPFPSPIGLIPRGRDFEVITGPLRFIIGGRSNQLLDQVWVDENWGYDFSDRTKILDSGNFDLMLSSDNRIFHTSNWTQNKIEMEEVNALRAVIKISGSFALADQGGRSFDYVARMTVYGGKTYLKLAFTLINRKGNSAEDFMRLEDLSFQVKLNLAVDQQRFVFGGTQQDHEGSFAESPYASLYQETSDRYLLSGAVQERAGKSAKSINLGWADLSDNRHGLSIAVKWFWQLYPKAFEVKNDGTITARLFPKQASPQNIYLGMAKTHDLLFYFHGKRDFASGQVKNALVGFQKPIYALAPPEWYCRNTKAMGHLAESSRAAYKSEYWPKVQKYDEWLVRSRDAMETARAMLYPVEGRELDAYGMLQFGGPVPKICGGEKTSGHDGLGDAVDYDYPHALYLHFFRTGDPKSLEIAEEGVAYLRDLNIAPSEIVSMRSRGNQISTPESQSIHDPGKNSRAASVSDSYSNLSLFDSFLLTGNRGALEAARLSLERALTDNGFDIAHNARNVANILLGFMRGYEVLGDDRYLNRADWVINMIHAWQDGNVEALRQLNPQLAEAWNEKYRDGYGPQSTMYGAVWEGLKQYYELRGRKDIPKYIQRAAEWIYRNPEKGAGDNQQDGRQQAFAITLSAGLAALYEYTATPKYWDLAMDIFSVQTGAADNVSCPGVFGLCFRHSQRFLWYLSREFAGPQKRELSLNSQ